MEKIVGYSIVTIGHPTRGRQYVVNLVLESGERIQKRLHGLFPTADTFDHEPQDLRNQAHLEVFNLIQSLHESGPRPPRQCKFKTCREAMTAYIEHYLETRKDRRVANHSKIFIEHFGELPVTRMTDIAAREFIERMIEMGLSYDTVRLRLSVAAGMVEWLRKQGMWKTVNPWHGILKEYEHRFKAGTLAKSVITPDEYEALLTTMDSDSEGFQTARQFYEVAFCTGLRPDEIRNLSTDNLDRENLRWGVFVTKTRGRELYRHIAVPRRLVLFISNQGITGQLEFPNLRKQFDAIRHRAELPMDLTPRFFGRISHTAWRPPEPHPILSIYIKDAPKSAFFSRTISQTPTAPRDFAARTSMLCSEKAKNRYGS